jgi:hypothetical protein
MLIRMAPMMAVRDQGGSGGPVEPFEVLDSAYTLTNAHSGLNLGVGGPAARRDAVGAVAGGSTLDGSWLELRPPSPGPAAQECAVVQQPDGTYELANRKSGKLLEDRHAPGGQRGDHPSIPGTPSRCGRWCRAATGP